MITTVTENGDVYCQYSINSIPYPCPNYKEWDEACTGCPLWKKVLAEKEIIRIIDNV